MARRKIHVRIGVISDVHGDHRALRDALSHLERLDCADVICAGDLLDWGPPPTPAIALLEQRRIRCVRGNHDFIDPDGRALDGTFLPPRTVAFIDALKPHWMTTIAGVRVAMWHARPGDLMRGIYPGTKEEDATALLEQARADVLIVGHTHVPTHITCRSGTIVNPGSLLRAETIAPLDIAASGTFGILELPSRRFTVHRTTDGIEVPIGGLTR